MAGRGFALLQPLEGGDEVGPRLVRVELLEEGAGRVLVARIAAERGQRVGGQRRETGERETPRDVLDMGIQAAVLVDDEHAGELGRSRRRTNEVGAYLAVPRGRRDLDPLGDDTRVVGRQDQRMDEVRGELVEQHRGGDAADGELRGAFEELPAIDVAVDVGIEQCQQLLVVVVRGLARPLRHGSPLQPWSLLDPPPGSPSGECGATAKADCFILIRLYLK